MIEAEIAVINRLGLHARAAAKLVKLLAGFQSEVMLKREHREVNAKSIMGVMMLAAANGSKLKARINGVDEEACLAAIQALFAARFDEGQ
jgi:phosphocarrier protein HPr